MGDDVKPMVAVDGVKGWMVGLSAGVLIEVMPGGPTSVKAGDQVILASDGAFAVGTVEGVQRSGDFSYRWIGDAAEIIDVRLGCDVAHQPFPAEIPPGSIERWHGSTPDQWTVRLGDGDELYIRYRSGWLSVTQWHESDDEAARGMAFMCSAATRRVRLPEFITGLTTGEMCVIVGLTEVE